MLGFILAIALVSACADSGTGSKAEVGGPPPSTAMSASTTVTTTSPVNSDSKPRPPSAPTTSNRRSSANGGGSPPAPAPRAEAFAGARGQPGSFATVLVRPQPASRLVLEVLQQAGAEPRSTTVAHLVGLLRESSGKPVSVATVVLPSGGGATTAENIRDLADRHGATAQGPDQAVVRIMFLGGQLAGEDSALGAAVRGDTAAVFVEKVRSAGSPLVGASAVETAVAAHELGHLLGLVDLVRSTGRADPEYPGHSANRGSVMYWAIESDLVTSVIAGPPPVDFDAADRADLAAIRSG